jgi:4-hydroxybenzoate polyprenyltransferase
MRDGSSSMQQQGAIRIWLAQLRVEQWAKNLLVFAPLIFALRLALPSAVGRSILAFVLFCAVSSAGYLLNDIRDRKQDRLHPVKQRRPLAAGALPIDRVRTVAIVLIVVALATSLTLGFPFAILLAAHCVLNVTYTFALKRVVMVDLLVITCGFLLRAIAGAVVINVPASSWFIVCTAVIALLVGFGKRRQEMVQLKENAVMHRPVLAHYSRAFLDRAVIGSAALSVLCYTLYTLYGQPLGRHHSSALLLTLPFVVAGIWRYLFLIFRGDSGGDPIEIIRTDRPSTLNLLLWTLTVVAILYWH